MGVIYLVLLGLLQPQSVDESTSMLFLCSFGNEIGTTIAAALRALRPLRALRALMLPPKEKHRKME
jgi:hypothetical protein